MFSLLIEHDILKAPSLAFKHWSNAGQPTFIAPVLSTSSSRQGVRECAHTLAVSPSQTYFAWKDIYILNLSPDNRDQEEHHSSGLQCKKNQNVDFFSFVFIPEMNETKRLHIFSLNFIVMVIFTLKILKNDHKDVKAAPYLSIRCLTQQLIPIF